MFALYQKPRNMERFEEYLQLLQGDTKGDLKLPLGGFNPMAKEHILDKLDDLRKLDAEKIVAETLNEINREYGDPSRVFQTAINLADDWKGGWTNRFATDFDSKFKINALVKRQFCTVYLWSSENYSPELIRERTREACFRTNYVAKYGQPVTLRDHVEQEKFVAKQNGNKTHLSSEDREKLQKIFDLQAESDDYNVIFHFFYGDEACKSLGFPFTASGTDAKGFDFCAG